jgi:hypothetical protein|tara:strand:+ start:308 stop:568 length:261 start_codon:yes stop_codon:yes gene_type:complete
VARKSRNKQAFKVNGQVIRPKKNEGCRNGRKTGSAEVQRVADLVDEYNDKLLSGEFPPEEGWHQFVDCPKTKGTLLDHVLRTKGHI